MTNCTVHLPSDTIDKLIHTICDLVLMNGHSSVRSHDAFGAGAAEDVAASLFSDFVSAHVGQPTPDAKRIEHAVFQSFPENAADDAEENPYTANRGSISWIEENLPHLFVEDTEYREPRTFHEGDTIPDDVQVVRVQPWNPDDLCLYAGRVEGGWRYAPNIHTAFTADADDTVFDTFEPREFPITEVPRFLHEDQTFTLRETAELLGRHGIDTGLNRLKRFLNEGICWTDGFGTPRECAADFLVETDKANAHRLAVVRVTPEGVNELVRVMGMAV